MKSLKSILEASVLADVDDQLEAGDVALKSIIEKFIKDNYMGIRQLTISDEPNADGKYEVSARGDIMITNKSIKSLTNSLFVWKKIVGTFSCTACAYLESLDGAPEEVTDDFWCTSCVSLKSLDGAPRKVGNTFECSRCEKLTSLKGCPKSVKGSFACNKCKSIKTLEGMPSRIGRNLNCSYCDSLESLKGCVKKVPGLFVCENNPWLKSLKYGPEYVGGSYCFAGCKSMTDLEGIAKEIGGRVRAYNCGRIFTEGDIRKLSRVNDVVEVTQVYEIF